MAFNGYLIMLGGSHGTVLPLKYMRYETYKITPNQRMDYNSTRDSSGVLHRTALAHTASKIEFNTPRMSNKEVDSMMTLIRSKWSSSTERRLTLYYYDPETNGYKSGEFYMPDIDFTISNVDTARGRIMYAETRIAFIEY